MTAGSRGWPRRGRPRPFGDLAVFDAVFALLFGFLPFELFALVLALAFTAAFIMLAVLGNRSMFQHASINARV